ncbi:MAG TPA: Rne/Rng family ribonuclease [Gaiellaceae bacterium]|nr:Rne/Rng family ribonuclease [Gaiellaceae bacterium]
MPWFRFRKKDDPDADRGSAPAELERVPAPDLTEPAADRAAGTADSTATADRPKRRRGSRGGRGRKKPGGAAAGASTAAAETAEKPQKSEQKKPRETRQLSQRQERRRNESGSRRRQAPRRAPLPAAKRELVVSVDVGERRVAVLEDGQVAEVYLERPERRSIAGNIYLGVVDNVLPGMEAAFVEVGLEKNGFLYVDEIVSPELERGHGRKIQDLIKRGETILVQAVKDPRKTKGARLTTQISLPGRFVVFVPQGEGLGVSRRLEDEERARLKDILKRLAVKEGGVIVRTAAEGASEEDIERDLVFLQRLWRSIQAKAKEAKAPELIYQEAELPLRVTRDLFTGDFEKAYVDDDRAYKRIVGYLKKTSPHMVERVVRYKETTPLMEAFGVEQEIKSTLNRRVDLPSGGYLIFDYAEAFTVIDVNTGRFVGSRGKNSGGRLEDTITKNNLEAVKEVVRQLRLRDIGGIIVIDFIDMANPKNRATVEEALRTELERDRTKTYVVEISPLGLVEMTRQNVTDGPREVMTRKCPTCGGDGIVYSDASAALDVERRLRALAAGSRAQAFRVELADTIAAALVGPGARRLLELEALTKKKFFLEGKPQMHLDHFVVLAEGKLADLAPAAPVEEGAEVMLQLVEVDRHDQTAAVGKLDGLDVVVADAGSLVGKRLKVRVERVLDGTAYGVLTRKAKAVPEPLTAEAEAEKPTRKPPARKTGKTGEAPEPDAAEAAEPEAAEEEPAAEGEETAAAAAPAKKKTRRGSRGGRNRKKKPAAAQAEGEAAATEELEAAGATEDAPKPPKRAVTIHVPGEDLGSPAEAEPVAAEAPAAEGEAPAAEGEAAEEAPKPKKKTRRGSRGGRNRKKKPAGAAAQNGSESAVEAADEPAPADEAEAEPEPALEAEPLPEPEPEVEPEPAPSANGDGEPEGEWGYVPMSEWLDEIDSGSR